VAAVEEVFTVAHLEKQPLRKVPRAGASIQHTFQPAKVGVKNEEQRIQRILETIALLCKTRGIIFLSCFQDCDRSDSVSLVTPRYSGKATPAQFRQHFPLVGDFEERDLKFLVKRYTTQSGDINYQALDRDVKEAESRVPEPSGEHASSHRMPQSPRSEASGKKVSSERSRRERILKETLESVDIIDRLKAIVSEKSLRLADCFVDFDRLRKGTCNMNQLRTVFTVLAIQIDARDYKNLGDIFCNEEGLFRYRDFCGEVCEMQSANALSWDMELPPTPSTPGLEERRPGSRIRYKAALSPSSKERVVELEEWVRNRAEVRSLDLKRCFQDFDRVCTGHVTRTRFTRIMDMLATELSAADTDLLCQAYCDTDNGQEFNYIDFCSKIKVRTTMEKAIDVFQSSRRPKYFDRSGDSISPWTPQTTSMSMYGEPNLKVGGINFSWMN
jgi:Ca2+-binding EF-hand superfamily protein